MKLMLAALAALDFVKSNYHSLVDPVVQRAEAVENVAVTTAEHVKAIEARLAAAEAALRQLEPPEGFAAPVLFTPTTITEAELEQLKPGELVKVDAPTDVQPVQIPLSAELQAAIDAQPATEAAAP